MVLEKMVIFGTYAALNNNRLQVFIPRTVMSEMRHDISHSANEVSELSVGTDTVELTKHRNIKVNKSQISVTSEARHLSLMLAVPG